VHQDWRDEGKKAEDYPEQKKRDEDESVEQLDFSQAHFFSAFLALD
jgi:hypothetical protein